MSKKNNAAAGAFEILKQLNGPLSVGIGTGSTTDCFTENFLPLLGEKSNHCIQAQIEPVNYCLKWFSGIRI